MNWLHSGIAAALSAVLATTSLFPIAPAKTDGCSSAFVAEAFAGRPAFFPRPWKPASRARIIALILTGVGLATLTHEQDAPKPLVHVIDEPSTDFSGESKIIDTRVLNAGGHVIKTATEADLAITFLRGVGSWMNTIATPQERANPIARRLAFHGDAPSDDPRWFALGGQPPLFTISGANGMPSTVLPSIYLKTDFAHSDQVAALFLLSPAGLLIIRTAPDGAPGFSFELNAYHEPPKTITPARKRAGTSRKPGAWDERAQDVLRHLERLQGEFLDAAVTRGTPLDSPPGDSWFTIRVVEWSFLPSDLSDTVSAYQFTHYFPGTDAPTLIIVLNTRRPMTVVQRKEILYHELREAHWMRRKVPRRDAHILASAEQAQNKAFIAPNGITHDFNAWLKQMKLGELESIVAETEGARWEHAEILQRYAQDPSAQYDVTRVAAQEALFRQTAAAELVARRLQFLRIYGRMSAADAAEVLDVPETGLPALIASLKTAQELNFHLDFINGEVTVDPLRDDLLREAVIAKESSIHRYLKILGRAIELKLETPEQRLALFQASSRLLTEFPRYNESAAPARIDEKDLLARNLSHLLSNVLLAPLAFLGSWDEYSAMGDAVFGTIRNVPGKIRHGLLFLKSLPILPLTLKRAIVPHDYPPVLDLRVNGRRSGELKTLGEALTAGELWNSLLQNKAPDFQQDRAIFFDGDQARPNVTLSRVYGRKTVALKAGDFLLPNDRLRLALNKAAPAADQGPWDGPLTVEEWKELQSRSISQLETMLEEIREKGIFAPDDSFVRAAEAELRRKKTVVSPERHFMAAAG